MKTIEKLERVEEGVIMNKEERAPNSLTMPHYDAISTQFSSKLHNC